jgi:hypothetical protein
MFLNGKSIGFTIFSKRGNISFFCFFVLRQKLEYFFVSLIKDLQKVDLFFIRKWSFFIKICIEMCILFFLQEKKKRGREGKG